MTTSLDKIEKKIRESGEKEIEEIDREAEDRIKVIKKEIEEEAEKAYSEVLGNRKKELDLIPRRILSDARLEKKKKIDAKKTEMVDKVFSEATARILKMTPKERSAVMKSLADNGAKTITDPVFYVDKAYSDLLPGAKTEDLKEFGVVIRSKDAGSSVDNTLASVMNGLQLALKPSIVKMLFKE